MEWPVSVKGVVFDDSGDTLLGLNERDEWELIGGRLEHGEQPEDALVREFVEESGLRVTPIRLVTTYVFEPIPNREVLILVYACRLDGGQLRVSDEHTRLHFHALPLSPSLAIPSGYRRAIELGRHG